MCPRPRALVLIVDDPDAPRGLFTHLVAFDIDPDARGFHEDEIPPDARLANNSYGRPEYAGPRPPEGEHRYFSGSTRSMRAWGCRRERAAPKSSG